MITIVLGNVGSYKTTLVSDWCLDALRNGFPVWANFKMGLKRDAGLEAKVVKPFPNFFPIKISELLTTEVEKGFVAVTEAYTFAESRISSSKLNRYFSYFGFQSRKAMVDVALDAQLESSIDLRLVALAELVILAEGLQPDGRVYYTFYKGGLNPMVERRWFSKRYFEVNVFPYFESYERINPIGFRDLATEMDRFDNTAWNSKIDVVCDLFEGQYEKYGIKNERDLMKYLISDFITSEGESSVLVAPVFDRLRSRLRVDKVKSML